MAWRRLVAKWNRRSNTLALEYPPIRLLTPSEPPLTLLEPLPESGYYHVKTSAGEEGIPADRDA